MKFKKTKKYTISNVIFIGILLLINVFYFTEINLNASSVLKNKLFQKKFQTLQSENEQLTQQISKVNSISNIYATAKSFNLVEVTRTSYLDLPPEKVARK